MFAIVLALIALVFAIIEVVRSDFRSLLAWAVVILAALVVLPELGLRL